MKMAYAVTFHVECGEFEDDDFTLWDYRATLSIGSKMWGYGDTQWEAITDLVRILDENSSPSEVA